MWLSWDWATLVWISACVNKLFFSVWCQTGKSCLRFNVFLWDCLSHPQSPKPISQSSDDWGSFSSFPIGSEGKKRAGIAPVGGWELEFWSSLCVSLNFLKLFNVYLYLMCVCMLVPLSVYLVHYEYECNQECLYKTLCVCIETFLIS